MSATVEPAPAAKPAERAPAADLLELSGRSAGAAPAATIQPEALVTQPPPASDVPVARAARPAPPATLTPLTTASEAADAPLGPSPLVAALSHQFASAVAADPATAGAWARWTPAQQADLQRLLSHPGQASCYAAAGTAAALLPSLVRGGQLLQTDRQGASTLQHLLRMQSQAAPAGLNSAELCAETVANLAQPGRINQHDRGTCTVTTLEFLHARSQPADYTRLLCGLLGNQGKVAFQGGDFLHRNATGVDPDNSGRSHVDRVYQSSMMNAAYQGIALYNNSDDSFYTLAGRQYRGSGLFDKHVDYLMTQTLGKSTKVMNFENDPKIFEADLRRARSLGHEVYVSLSWSPDPGDKHSSHALAFERFQGDEVLLRNPWGDGESGGDNGPPRQVVGAHGEISMKRADFFTHLTSAVRPKRPFLHVWTNRLRFWISGESASGKA